MWFRACPLFVSLAPSHRVSDEHVAVVALVGDKGVVRDGGVDGASVQGVARYLTLDGCQVQEEEEEEEEEEEKS